MVRFLMFIELIAILVVFSVVLTQIIIPILRGTMFFPLLRRERKLEGRIAKAQQDILEKELEVEAENLERKASDETTRRPGASN